MFNQRFPSVPALDTAGLVELIKSPQKAIELWSKYEEARKVYEAQKAEFEAVRAELTEKQNQLAQQAGDVNNAIVALQKEQAQFEAEKKQWEVQKKLWLQKLEETEKSQALTAQSHSDAYKELNRSRLELEDAQAAFDEFKMAELASYTARIKALEAREAAVAAREVKADELSKLLKAV